MPLRRAPRTRSADAVAREVASTALRSASRANSSATAASRDRMTRAKLWFLAGA